MQNSEIKIGVFVLISQLPKVLISGYSLIIILYYEIIGGDGTD